LTPFKELVLPPAMAETTVESLSIVKVPVTVSMLERVWVTQSWLLFEASARQTAKEGLKVLSAASSYVGDDRGDVIVGTWTKRAEAFQPGVSRGNNGFTGPLQKNLKEAIGIKTRGLRVGGDSNDGVLALSGNVAGLSECAANGGYDK